MRVVITGFGRAGRQHAAAIERAPGVTVHSVLESDEGVATAPFTRAPSWDDVLDDPTVDAVALCVPPGGRARWAAAAAAAGKDVLLEKPPCMSVAELDRLPGRTGVMLQHRFRLPREIVDRPFKSAAGTLLVSRPRDALTHYTGWRGDSAEALGGITAHLGVHYLDLACQVLGAPESVEVHDYRECAPGIDVNVSGLVRFAGGSTLVFTVAADVPARAEHLVVAGDGRSLSITDGAVAFRDGDEVTERPAEPAGVLRAKVYAEFARGPDLCSLERARAVTAVLDGVRAR
ncbi:Gfo/Idh/MocA family protein [Actinomadura sp. GTD37]|uniref:Gfo/Idh/MocA family protein n=1 Tax=Actinomadura sp. GTD37 TaxID=1778030 RepID=UPI0035BEDB3F